MTNKHYFYLSLIILVGLILRLINLNQSLWLDEAITALAVKNYSLVGLITKFVPGDFHPPLYYLLLKFWSSLLGFSEVSLRSLSVAFGILTVPVVYLIGKRIADHRAGLLASLFLAVNPLAIYYSQEARMYTLTMFLLTLTVYFFITSRWLLFVVTYALTLYCDYMPIFMLPVFFLLIPKNTRYFWRYAGILLLLLIPLANLVLTQLANGWSLAKEVPLWSKIVGGFDLKAFALVPVKFIIGRISFENKYLYALIITPILALYFWIIARTKDRLLWCWLTTPLILAAITSTFIPVFSYFRFLYALPAFVLLLALGVRGSKFLAAAITLISLTAILYFNSTPAFHREDWRGLVSYIFKHQGLILMPSKAQAAPLYYYFSDLKVFDSQDKIVPGGDFPLYYVDYVATLFDPDHKSTLLISESGRSFKQEVRFTGLVVKIFQ